MFTASGAANSSNNSAPHQTFGFRLFLRGRGLVAVLPSNETLEPSMIASIHTNFATHASINNTDSSKKSSDSPSAKYGRLRYQQFCSGASVAHSNVHTLSSRNQSALIFIEQCKQVSFYAFFNGWLLPSLPPGPLFDFYSSDLTRI